MQMNTDNKVRLPSKLHPQKGNYASVGDVQQVFFRKQMPGDHLVAIGARRLAIGLLRKGQGMMGRYHNALLADDIFAELDRRCHLGEYHRGGTVED